MAAVVLVLVMASGAFVAMALLGGSEPSSAGFSAGGTPTQVVIEQGGMPRVSPIPGATPVGDGKSTLSCSIGGELVIDGRQLNVDGTVIDAAINCRIRIKNSRLKGRTVIAGAMTAQIRIENSTLEAEHAAIDCAMACDITIEKNSKLVSRDGGVRLAQGSKLRIDESTIDAQGVAIDVGRASNVRIERSKISGKRAALEIESPGDLVLTSTTISGKKKVEKGVRISER